MSRITKVATNGRFYVVCEHAVAEYEGRDMYYVYCQWGDCGMHHHLCGSLTCIANEGEYEDQHGHTHQLGKYMRDWLWSVEESV